MNRISIVSRMLVAFASGAVLCVFFLPAWRIDLFAPQYPEGLTMKIWINDITGDVDVINGLNHYIGMKEISPAMFPEFKYIPIIVAFFVALGLAIAFSGRRKFLFAYLVLTAIGGALAFYDFYRWAYDYGHNLDPKAPIQVPGLSYQPPLFGHKRLLNFDAYSFPDVGGWIVIGAGALAFSVWFVEWFRVYREKRATRKKSRPAIASILVILIFAAGCKAGPEPIKLREDACSYCRMTIMDPKFGGETITKKGKVYKFDDLICQLDFLQEGKVAEKDVKQHVVVNYIGGDFLDVESAVFLISDTLKSPMGSNTAAFASEAEAAKLKINGNYASWDNLREKLK